MKIYITRHGQNEDNRDGVLNGHRDLPLTSTGLEQAIMLSAKIINEGITFNAVYTSPLIRAVETAKIITKNLGLVDPIVDNDLIERDFGVKAGAKISTLKEIYGKDVAVSEIIDTFLSPHAESFEGMMRRARQILDFMEVNHRSTDSILLVCHGYIGKILYAEYYGLQWRDVLNFEFGNCEIILLSEDSPKEDTHVF